MQDTEMGSEKSLILLMLYTFLREQERKRTGFHWIAWNHRRVMFYKGKYEWTLSLEARPLSEDEISDLAEEEQRR